MLIDREDVSMDGNSCNKVGTSYNAFNTQQQNACEQPEGSCLDNDLKAVHKRDTDEIEEGRVGPHQLDRHGLSYEWSNNRYELVYKITEAQTTLVRLELVADRI